MDEFLNFDNNKVEKKAITGYIYRNMEDLEEYIVLLKTINPLTKEIMIVYKNSNLKKKEIYTMSEKDFFSKVQTKDGEKERFIKTVCVYDNIKPWLEFVKGRQI